MVGRTIRRSVGVTPPQTANTRGAFGSCGAAFHKVFPPSWVFHFSPVSGLWGAKPVRTLKTDPWAGSPSQGARRLGGVPFPSGSNFLAEGFSSRRCASSPVSRLWGADLSEGAPYGRSSIPLGVQLLSCRVLFPAVWHLPCILAVGGQTLSVPSN